MAFFASHRQDMNFKMLRAIFGGVTYSRLAFPNPFPGEDSGIQARLEVIKSSQVLNFASHIFLLPFS